jgi:hypothetical protein
MSVTQQARNGRRPGTAAGSWSAVPAEDTTGVVLGSPPKLRRRPVVAAASVVAVCGGGLLSAYAYTSTANTHAVLAVTATVHRGDVIMAGEVATVRIGVDPALHPVAADRLGRVVGQRAATDLPAGSLVTEESVTATLIPPRDMSVVGVGLPSALLPGEPLQAGDRVRVVATPGQQGEVAAGKQRTLAATVVSVHPDPDNAQTVVSLQVPHALAAEVAARASTGKVALVLDSRER